MLELAQQADRATPGWRLLGTEFRLHAARDPQLAVPARQLAELVLVIETGIAMERWPASAGS
jgi:hypothetical protein